MISYKIDQKQLQQLLAKLDRSKMQSAVDIALKRIGMAMEKSAHDKAPYKTGHLRGSIVSEQTKTSVTTGTNVVYAAIHEFGGMAGRGRKVKIPARPYLRPGLEEQKGGKALQIITEEIKRNL
jgi:HK97 gp10 family phage protein